MNVAGLADWIKSGADYWLDLTAPSLLPCSAPSLFGPSPFLPILASDLLPTHFASLFCYLSKTFSLFSLLFSLFFFFNLKARS